METSIELNNQEQMVELLDFHAENSEELYITLTKNLNGLEYTKAQDKKKEQNIRKNNNKNRKNMM